jgi:hypothetical protein
VLGHHQELAATSGTGMNPTRTVSEMTFSYLTFSYLTFSYLTFS